MKFVGEKEGIVSKRNDTVKPDNKEIGRPAEVQKPKSKPISEPVWKDAVTTTLVNVRKDPSINSEAILQIKGGIVVKINPSDIMGGFTKIKLEKLEGYVKTEYLKKV